MTSNVPKKSLGQHWLRDAGYLQHIIDMANVQPDDVVLEVGPGLGTLTEGLAKRASKVIAVEYDTMLIDQLTSSVAPNVNVINGDILTFDLRTLPDSYKVVANIPYYLTSALVRKLLTSENPPQTIALLVQKEVAERIAAEPGKMSLLSVSAQFYADIELGDIVPAEAFEPAPKVDSRVVVMNYRKPQNEIDEATFFRIVKAGFAERRKKLVNSLAGGLQLSKDQVSNYVLEAGFGEDVRAQELSLQDWQKLYTVLKSQTTDKT